MNDNLKLWRRVEKTDVTKTKTKTQINKDGGKRNITTINPMYQNKIATREFGIQGIGWGVYPESEKFFETKLDETILLNYDAILFFNFEGEQGEIGIHSSVRLAYRTSGGYIKIDDEARKKVVTDAKTKGLSELGINSDVFMGQFDDDDYIATRTAETQIEQSENKEEFLKEKLSEIYKKADDAIKLFQKLPSVATLESQKNSFLSRIKRDLTAYNFDPNKFDAKILSAYEKRKLELNKK